jgi:hypothetical protein
MEASVKASKRPTSLSQMRRAARRALAREAKAEATAIAAAKQRLLLARSTSSMERRGGVPISPAANSRAHGVRWCGGGSAVLVGNHDILNLTWLCRTSWWCLASVSTVEEQPQQALWYCFAFLCTF